MRKQILTVILFCGTLFCASAQESFQIAGTLKNQDNNKITITYFDGTKNVTNSVDAVNGNFLITGPALAKPVVARLNTSVDRSLYLGEQKNSMSIAAPPLEFVLSNTKLVVTGDAEDINHAKVEGDAYNAGFNKLRQTELKNTTEAWNLSKRFVELKIMGATEDMKEMGQAMLENRKASIELRKNFVKENPSEFVSAYILGVNAREYNLEELKASYNQLSPVLQSSTYGENIASRIKVMAVTASGGAAPDFTKTDINGNQFTLSQLQGKYVLVDFWGSWCGPCRAANPHLKELYAQYKDKGFEILGVASEKFPELAKAQAAWKGAVEKDGLPWIQVLNNEADMKLDVVKLYGIDGFPTQLLLDRNGKIIAKWLGVNKELDDKLKSIFN